MVGAVALLIALLLSLVFSMGFEIAGGRLGDSIISSSSRDFIFADLDEDRDGLLSTEELKEVYTLSVLQHLCAITHLRSTSWRPVGPAWTRRPRSARR